MNISGVIKCASIAVLSVVVLFVCALCWRYPVKYENEIKQAAAENGLKSELVAAVVWTESGFDEKARSKRGAVGLMQLMPSTAKWCAESLNIEYGEEMLNDAQYNIRLGTFYLKYLFEKFGDERLALAAYNAGEGNVRKWLAMGLTEFPFKETANYVERVANAEYVYAVRLS